MSSEARVAAAWGPPALPALPAAPSPGFPPTQAFTASLNALITEGKAQLPSR